MLFIRSLLKKWRESFTTKWTKTYFSPISNLSVFTEIRLWSHQSIIHLVILLSPQCCYPPKLPIVGEMLPRLQVLAAVEGTASTSIRKMVEIQTRSLRRCVAMAKVKCYQMSMSNNLNNRWTNIIITITDHKFQEL